MKQRSNAQDPADTDRVGNLEKIQGTFASFMNQGADGWSVGGRASSRETASIMDPRARTFVVVEHDQDGMALIHRTLRRKYPHAKIESCVEAQQALAILAESPVDAVIVHRPIGMNGLDAIALIRKANRNVPIIMVSSVDYHTEALAAGADSFLLYDAWLMLGGVVADSLKNSDSRNPWPTCGTPPSAAEVKS